MPHCFPININKSVNILLLFKLNHFYSDADRPSVHVHDVQSDLFEQPVNIRNPNNKSGHLHDHTQGQYETRREDRIREKFKKTNRRAFSVSASTFHYHQASTSTNGLRLSSLKSTFIGSLEQGIVTLNYLKPLSIDVEQYYASPVPFIASPSTLLAPTSV